MDKSETERRRTPSVRLTLGRNRKPVASPTIAAPKYSAIHEVLTQEWGGQDAPSHAWFRIIMSTEVERDTFLKSYQPFQVVRSAFGRRALVLAVILDPHTIRECDIVHSVDVDGQHDIALVDVDRHIDGGTHILIAIEAKADEFDKASPNGLGILEAVESVLRASIGNSALASTRYTKHIHVATGTGRISSPSFTAYGAEELARTDIRSIDRAIELIAAGSRLSPDKQRRLTLGLKWANSGFTRNDLLAGWTALEILAAGHGRLVYSALAKAYTGSSDSSQKLANSLGIDWVFAVRNAMAHKGEPVHFGLPGSSVLLALAHDLARALSGLPCEKIAKPIIEGVDGGMRSIIRIIENEQS
jgi:hypothetical protein